jgi:hypothetical protein
MGPATVAQSSLKRASGDQQEELGEEGELLAAAGSSRAPELIH